VRKWLAERSKQKQPTRFEELPPEVKEWVHASVPNFIRRLVEGLSRELQRGFATKLAELGRKRTADGFRLWLEQGDSGFHLALSLERGGLQVDQSVRLSGTLRRWFWTSLM
jgi:hypothetical protein